MNKQQLIEYVARHTGLPPKIADQMVTVVFDGILEGLRRDRRVSIASFGSWHLKDVAARPNARNPQTGERVHVPAGQALRFRVSVRLRSALKRGEVPSSSRKRTRGEVSGS